jgi:transposase
MSAAKSAAKCAWSIHQSPLSGLNALELAARPALSMHSFRLHRGQRRQYNENLPDLAVLIEPLLVVRRVLREQFVILHRRLLAIVRDDEVCRRLMTTPGVGPVVALTYRATVDVPARFRKSKSVGAVFGLTCSKYQSGEIDRSNITLRR